VRANPGFLLGVKVRMEHDAVARWDAARALAMAREAADLAGGLLMVHVSGTPLPLAAILEVLHPGDILTHAYNGHPEGILDHRGEVRGDVRAAAERGVVIDVGHAGVHFDIEVARAAFEQEFFPTTISTDRHRPPPGRVVYGMDGVISELLALGMPLDDAIAAGTCRPAAALGLAERLGSLAPGMAGDAAVFDVDDGRFEWLDTAGHSVTGTRRLRPRLTVKDGEVVWSSGAP
jgi:dihydroorotase